MRLCAWLHWRRQVKIEDNYFWSPLHPFISALMLHLPGANLLGFALLGPCNASQFPQSPLSQRSGSRGSLAKEKAQPHCAEKLHLLTPRAMAGRKTQCAHVTCMAKPSCFLWFIDFEFERALQYSFALSFVVPTGRPRTGCVRLQLRLSWCSMGRAPWEGAWPQLPGL